MKVLITGGYGFIGSHTAERFYKEGYEVFVIDNLSSGEKGNVKVKHKFYPMNVESKKCEEVFANNHFDVVIHLAGHIDAAASVENPYMDAEANILGLVNMLDLSSRYNVKKFIFASSAAVYGNNEKIPLMEDDVCDPISPYGMSKLTGERYCKLWKTMRRLDTICLRFSNVYGPRQSTKGEGGVVSIFMNNIFAEKKLLVYGDGKQTRDFVFVEDVVDAIYKSTEFCSKDVLNVSSNEQKTVNQLIDCIRKVHTSIEVDYTQPRTGDILHSKLSNDHGKKELSWAPMYDLDQGIEKTYQWYKENLEKKQKENDIEDETKENTKDNRLLKKILPYIENILAFLVIFLLSKYSKEYVSEAVIDFKLLYIIVIGVIYGLRQASIAVFLSCALFIWEISSVGHDWISLIYNVNTLIHFSLYIFIGTVLGYSMDSKKYEIDTKEEELKEMKEKFDFLYDIYNESKVVRQELQYQILTAEDSFGKIYRIISALDTLEADKVFGQAIGVIEAIMKSKYVCIFSVSKSQNYLRLIARSKEGSMDTAKSIKVSEFAEIEKMIHTKEMFINKDLKKSLPMMMTPIVVNGKVLAIIAIYSMEFETLSLYKQNLLKVVAELITSSLARAYQYDEAIYDEKYIKGTLMMKSKYFRSLVQSKREDKQKNDTDFVLLKISECNMENEEISHKIGNSIRELDYIGVNEKKELLVLLSNTRLEEAQYVIDRLSKINIDAEIYEEGEDHDVIYLDISASTA